jgi:4-hydroxybenzoyl-CoA thioesterase
VTSFIFSRQFRIEWGDCDPAGIVFNPRFFQFFDTNTWLMFEAALGVNMQELNRAFDIAGIVLVDVQGNFLKPAAFGDAVELTSRVKEFRRTGPICWSRAAKRASGRGGMQTIPTGLRRCRFQPR